MARKKRALKAEVIDEAGEVNLSGTTRLDFSLNKADIIDFYCAEEEEKLEAEIAVAAKALAVIESEIEELKEPLASKTDKHGRVTETCPGIVKKAVLKEHKSIVTKTLKAIRVMAKVGHELNSLGTSQQNYGHPSEKPFEVINIHLLDDPTVHRQYNADILMYSVNPKGRKPLAGFRRQLGRNVPDSKLHDLSLGQGFWSQYTSVFSTKTNMHVMIQIGNYRTGSIPFPVDDLLNKDISALVNKLNDRAPLMKKLHDLLVKHAELPQMKKLIKKQVVGRVLKNTDEGKLLLTALKGIRGSGARLLTDAASNIESAS